jgi:hypothetical protein
VSTGSIEQGCRIQVWLRYSQIFLLDRFIYSVSLQMQIERRFICALIGCL